jgi:hypothetical protein
VAPDVSPVLDHFLRQADFCAAMGSPFTAHLIEAMAEDLRTGGPTADLVGDWPASAHADAVSLRLAAHVRFHSGVAHRPGLSRA